MVYSSYALLEDSIEINPSSQRKYQTNLLTLHTLYLSLNNALEDSKHFVEQVESFMASSFTLANNLYKIGLHFPQVGELSTSISQLNKEINTLLPQSLRECKLILDYSLENSVYTDHTETFKNLKQEVDKYLVESTQYRRELKALLHKYTKSTSDSQSDKIANVMAKLSQSLVHYEKYSSLLESELDEFCGNRKKYLLSLSQNILNLHHLVHFGKKLTEQQLMSQQSPDSVIKKTFSNDSISSSLKKLVVSPAPTTFDEIIGNTIFLKAFRIFAEKQHGIENLLFYLDTHTLKDMESRQTSREVIRNMYLNMYNNYIVPGASFEINIDSEARSAIDERRLNLFLDDDFYPSLSYAVESISNLLNFSMFPLFLKSPLYQAAVMMDRGSQQPTENVGLSRLVKSLDTLLSHPIGLEYFLLYLRPSSPTSPSSSQTSSSHHHHHHHSHSHTTSINISSSTSPSSSAPSSASTSPSSLSPLSATLLSPRFSPLLLTSPAVSMSDARNMVYLWLAISKLKELTDDNIDTFSYELYDTYLKVGAEKEISVLSGIESIRSTIQESIASKSNTIVHLFDNIGQDIILQLTNTHFQIFLNGPVCRDMLSREEKMIKYMERDKKKPENKVDLQFEQISKEKIKAIFPRTPKHMSIKPGTLTPILQGSSEKLSLTTSSGSNSSTGSASKSNNPYITTPATPRENPPPVTLLSPPSPTHPQYLQPLPPIPSNPSSNSLNNSTNSLSSTNSVTSEINQAAKHMFSPNLMNIQSQGRRSSSVDLNNNSITSSTSSSSLSSMADKPNEVFCYILSEPIWLDNFKRFVKMEKCEELLLCWMELERYCRGRPSLTAANNIYENFFLDGSPLEVNLEPELKHQVKHALKSENLNEINEQLKLSCQASFELLRVDCFSRFIRSNVFKELAQQVGDPFDSKNRKKITIKK